MNRFSLPFYLYLLHIPSSFRLQREYVQNIENKLKNWIVLLWYPPNLHITIYKWAKYIMSKTMTICRRDKYTMSKTMTIYKWDKYATSKIVTIYERGKYAIYEIMTIWMRAWDLSMKSVIIWGIIDSFLRYIWFRRINSYQTISLHSSYILSFSYDSKHDEKYQEIFDLLL